MERNQEGTATTDQESTQNNLAFIDANLSFLTLAIVKLEKQGLPFTESQDHSMSEEGTCESKR